VEVQWLVVLTFFVALISTTLSGMSGGGGGFVTVPYLIFIGLPPANALATSKMAAVGTSAGGIAAFKGKGVVRKKLVLPLMAITLACSLVAAWLIPRIESELFTNIIGAALILLVPTLFVKRASLQPGHRTTPWVVAGFVLYTVCSFLQTVVGSGFGSILAIVLMLLFGLTALESNATRRVAQSVQAVVLFVLLAAQGLVVWSYGAAALLGAFIGSNIGSRIALKKGSKFVKFILAAIMIVSGIALLIM
jgi:uncharacterized membrane protein YfcA